MKTFDEVIENLNPSDDAVMQIAINFKDEMMNNPRWFKLIVDNAMAIQNNSDEGLQNLCARLHTIFVIGMYVGIEMEKLDG